MTRQQLAEQMWGTDTFVDFEQGLNYAIGRSVQPWKTMRTIPGFLKLLPRRGYRFIAPVERIDPFEPSALQNRDSSCSNGAKHKPRQPYWKWAVAGFCTVILIVLVFRYRKARSIEDAAKNSDIQSIAVLPLSNLSADPNQEYFSDGLTDELITELTKTSNLRVISRTSSHRLQRLAQECSRNRPRTASGRHSRGYS